MENQLIAWTRYIGAALGADPATIRRAQLYALDCFEFDSTVIADWFAAVRR